MFSLKQMKGMVSSKRDLKMHARKIVTQIGSLPYDNVEQAVEFSLKHDIPFLPELPKLGDAMLDYIKNPGRMSCLDTFKRKTDGFDTVKVQCVGPATLVLSGYAEDVPQLMVYLIDPIG